ncbi:MAG: alpha/beta hydrolase, partial [Sphingomonadales bacterium]
MKRLIFLWIAWLISYPIVAATVDTIWVDSPTMKRSFRCVVVMPDTDQKSRLPVTYLLHGYGGDYSNWIKKVPALARYADQFRMMIVCPDGQNNWYINSPVVDSIRWETYIAEELPAYIDSHYPTVADRKARAITGLSMGGHGGLYLGLKRSAVFGACGSMSGGVDLLPFPNKWQLNQL